MKNQYKIILNQLAEGGYIVSAPSLPGCVAQGETREEVGTNRFSAKFFKSASFLIPSNTTGLNPPLQPVKTVRYSRI